ncbi:MAG: ribonuclease BN, partial [Sphingomicrobium sp.]
MRDFSTQSPEARRKRLASMRAAFGPDVEKKLRPKETVLVVIKRVLTGVWADGFIHAGNLAYLSLLALFPFFILAAAMAHLFGQSEDAQLTVFNVLRRLPPDVAATLREPINEVLL